MNKEIEHYIHIAEAFAKNTYQSIAIIDFYNQKVIYTAPNFTFLYGKPKRTSKEESILDFFESNISPSELPLLNTIKSAGLEFYKNAGADQSNWSYSFDIHFLHQRTPILMNYKLIPLTLNTGDGLWLFLCITSISRGSEPGNLKMYNSNLDWYYQFNIDAHRWIKHDKIRITKTEQYIVILSASGLSSVEIAEALNVSLDAVKKAKQRLYQKLGAKNITEVIAIASLGNHLV